MSTTTTRNSLVKPGYADAADIAVINTNMDTIDASFAKCNWAASSAPTVNDDSGDGYSVGSMWFDTTGHDLYIAETVGSGTATWRALYPQGSSAYTSASDPTANDDSGDGFVVGSLWINTTGHKVFIAEDVTPTAAVWRQLYPAVVTGYVKTDGSTPLTANWDVGAYKVTANQLESDVATGTAPLVIASTTAVTNLNADLLDGRNESEFAALNGRSGGQTLYGGTDASNNLTLQATSNATPGSIIMPTANVSLGTKATTASAFALAIHEGAAAAPNKVVFLDADGTTGVGALWKTTADSMVLSAGDTTSEDLKIATTGAMTVAAGIACSGNVSTDAGYFSASRTLTDTAGTIGTALTGRPVCTSSASVTNYNIYSACFPEVRAGVTNSGNIYSFYTETMRNHNGAATDDAGTLSGLYAQQAFFGHYNLHADETPVTTYADGLRIVPYYMTGTISNLFCLEISTGGTGGTVSANWGIYDAHAGNNYYGATYNRFQTTSGDRVIYVVQTSTTDPIADAWNTHSNERYKNDLGPIDSDIDRHARYMSRKAVADRTLHTWTRKVELDDPAHYEAMFPIEDDRPRTLPGGEQVPAKDLEVRQAEQDYAIYKHIETCKTLKKFQKPNIGLFAEEAPEEIVSYGLDGQPEGIDLGAYIGWVHRAVDALHYDVDFLEVDVADIDNVLWLVCEDLSLINDALCVVEDKVKVLEAKNVELESKNDALLRKHEDYERRMALLEQRLLALETK
jgi:hypothetical protein